MAPIPNGPMKAQVVVSGDKAKLRWVYFPDAERFVGRIAGNSRLNLFSYDSPRFLNGVTFDIAGLYAPWA